MTKYAFLVEIECETYDQATTVMAERMGYDEQYDDNETGQPFDYTVGWR